MLFAIAQIDDLERLSNIPAIGAVILMCAAMAWYILWSAAQNAKSQEKRDKASEKIASDFSQTIVSLHDDCRSERTQEATENRVERKQTHAATCTALEGLSKNIDDQTRAIADQTRAITETWMRRD